MSRYDNLYVIASATGAFKVGRARNSTLRLAELQVGNPGKLELVTELVDAGHLERRVHARLIAFREGGEWFQDCAEARMIVESALGLKLNWPFVSTRALAQAQWRSPTVANQDSMLCAKDAASAVGLSLAAFWRAVASQRMPTPFYPAARKPVWRHGELLTALEMTRAMPREQMATRRRRATNRHLLPAAQ
jgi:predicted DNA-binding transcriptional regulator AlpA